MTLVDLVSMTALLSITAPVREAGAALARGDTRGMSVNSHAKQSLLSAWMGIAFNQ